VGPRFGLNRCGKSHPHRYSSPGPSSLWTVALPNTILGPLVVPIAYEIIGGMSLKLVRIARN